MEDNILNYTQLRDLINEDFSSKMSLEEEQELANEIARGMQSYTSAYDPSWYAGDKVDSGVKGGWGSSIYDPETITEDELNSLSDIRAENQPWYAQIGAGLLKGSLLAGTTIIDGTLGLGAGLVKGLSNVMDKDEDTTFMQGFIENPVSRAVADFTAMVDEEVPNYRTEEELNNQWYQNLGTANFWGDSFIKNLGFTVGAMYGGIPYAKLAGGIAKALKASGKATSMAASITGSTISSVNEARSQALGAMDAFGQKALQGIEQRTQEEIESLNTEFRRRNTPYNEELGILNVAMSEEEYQERYSNIMRAKDLATEEVNKKREKVGNGSFAVGLALLIPSNFMQLKGLYGRGYKPTARHSNTIAMKGEKLADGVESTFVEKIPSTLGIFAKNAASEGIWEEGMLTAADAGFSNMYNSEIANLHSAQLNPESSQEVSDNMSSFIDGIISSFDDGSFSESSFIGGLTGGVMSARIRKPTNSKGEKQSMFYLEDREDWRQHKQLDDEIVSSINANLENPKLEALYNGLIGHYTYQNIMNGAVLQKNEKDYKTAEQAQLINMVDMFDRAGMIEDLKAYVNDAFDTSEENLAEIIKTTTEVKDGEIIGGAFAEFASYDKDTNTIIPNLSEDNKAKMAESLTKDAEKFKGLIDKYQEINNYLQTHYGDVFNAEQMQEIMYKKSMSDDWMKRRDVILEEVKPIIQKGIDNISSQLDLLNKDSETLDNLITENRNIVEKKKKVRGKKEKEILKEAEESLKTQSSSREKLDEKIAINKEVLNTLNTILSLEPAQIMKELGKKENVNIKTIINTLLESSSPITGMELGVKMNDATALHNAAVEYQYKIKEYLENPSKVQEDITNTSESINKEETKKKYSSIKEQLQNASNLPEFREALNTSEDTEIKEEVLNTLIEEGNTLAKDYKDVSRYQEDIQKAIYEQNEDSTITEAALELQQRQYENAENLADIGNPNSVIMSDDKILYDETLTLEENSDKYQSARYVVQKAMLKVNNDTAFRDSFAKDYKEFKVDGVPNNAPKNDTTGSDETSTLPPVNSNAKVEIVVDEKFPSYMQEKEEVTGDISSEVGDTTEEEIQEDNKDTNALSDEATAIINKINEIKQFYKTTIPEWHIEASKFDDFRPFNEIVKDPVAGPFYHFFSTLSDREKTIVKGFLSNGNPKTIDTIKKALLSNNTFTIYRERQYNKYQNYDLNFDILYNYLQNNNAFEYVNTIGTLKQGDPINFMIDSQFEEEMQTFFGDKYKSTTIFMTHNNQIVGVLDEKNTRKYEGLYKLRSKILQEYTEVNNTQVKQKRFIATPSTTIAKMMIGKFEYGKEQKTVSYEGSNAIDGIEVDGKIIQFGILQGGVMKQGKKQISNVAIPQDAAKKDGRLYALVPNVQGGLSTVNMRIKHFNKEEFDYTDATTQSTEIFKLIEQAVDSLVKVNDSKDIENAMKALMQVLYVRNVYVKLNTEKETGKPLRLQIKLAKRDANGALVMTNSKDENQVPILEGEEHTVFLTDMQGNTKNPTESIKDVMKILTKFNLPLQVRSGQLQNESYRRSLLNSGVLTSNVISFKMKSNWFITNYLDEQGNIQSAISPQNAPISTTRFNTPIKGVNSAIPGTKISSIYGNKNVYYIQDNGDILDNNGQLVTVKNPQLLIDLADAQKLYGDSTEGESMYNNKVLLPNGRVVDRTTQKYVVGEDKNQIIDIIKNKKSKKDTQVSSTDVVTDKVLNPKLEEQNPIDVTDEEIKTPNSKVGYYIKEGKLYKGYVEPLATIEEDDLYITYIPNRTKGFAKDGKERIATLDCLVIFPNGNVFTVAKGIAVSTKEKTAKSIVSNMQNSYKNKSEAFKKLTQEETIISREVLPEIEEVIPSESDFEESNDIEDSVLVGVITGNDSVTLVNPVNSVIEQSKNSRANRVSSRPKLRVVSGDEPLMDFKKELKWLKKVLPKYSEAERLQIIDDYIKVANSSEKAWGGFYKGIIILSNTAAEGTLYHEAFHAVFNTLLTPEERNELYKDARVKFGDKDFDALEEDLAEGFREYVMTQDKQSWSDRILNTFRRIFNISSSALDMQPYTLAIYHKINSGKFKKNEIQDDGNVYTKEMSSIKKKAIANGTFMKAPNGNPTNLNERQWVHTRTKAFKKWFGDWINNPENSSKVVDENGEPLVVYHGTPTKDISIFKTRYQLALEQGGRGSGQEGFYFTPNIEYASRYKVKDLMRPEKNPEGVVMEVFLNVRNMAEFNVQNFPNTFVSAFYSTTTEDRKMFESLGYDGVNLGEVGNNIDNERPEILVFNPNQIKSATDNIGTYDSENNNIKYRKVTKSKDNTYKTLSSETQERLLQKGWSIERFDAVSQEEREHALKCIEF